MGLALAYRPVLANPQARTILVLGALVRMPMFATWIVLTLHIVNTLDRSYAEAGLAAALTAAAAGVGSPWRGRVIDRHGLRVALVPCIAGSIALWSIAVWLDFWPLVALATIAAFFTVPVFQIVRMALVGVVAPEHRRSALSVDSVLVEIAFMTGPLAAAWAATTWHTGWVLLSTELLLAAGGVLIWLVDPPLGKDASSTEHDPHPTARSWFGLPFLAVLACTVAAAAVLQITDLGIVATLNEQDATRYIGLVLAAWGLGSLIGGLAYGALSDSVPVWVLLGGLAAVTAPAALANGPWTLLGFVFLAGVLCAPTITATIEEVSKIVPPRSLGEAMGWHAACLTLGSALFAPLAGLTIDAWQPSAAFMLAALVGLLAAGGIWLASVRPPRTTLAA